MPAGRCRAPRGVPGGGLLGSDPPGMGAALGAGGREPQPASPRPGRPSHYDAGALTSPAAAKFARK